MNNEPLVVRRRMLRNEEKIKLSPAIVTRDVSGNVIHSGDDRKAIGRDQIIRLITRPTYVVTSSVCQQRSSAMYSLILS